MRTAQSGNRDHRWDSSSGAIEGVVWELTLSWTEVSHKYRSSMTEVRWDGLRVWVILSLEADRWPLSRYRTSIEGDNWLER